MGLKLSMSFLNLSKVKQALVSPSADGVCRCFKFIFYETQLAFRLLMEPEAGCTHTHARPPIISRMNTEKH